MTQKNRFLNAAKEAKFDEFFTQRHTIENELQYYDTQLFAGKRVFCNCDDPAKSEFFRYFDAKFNDFGLAKLTGTHYAPGVLSLEDEEPQVANKRVITPEHRGPRTPLQGDGDFRSEECVELLKEADIVCTNPPFSLFGEYLPLLMKHNKQFLVIGNINALKSKALFPLIQTGQIWLGGSNVGIYFIGARDTSTAQKAKRTKDGKMFIIWVSTAVWYTNLPHKRRTNEEIPLYASYSPDKYPQYDNYNAIEVGKVAEIPMDYDGEMGVPITFLLKHNPKQFEIVQQPPPNLVTYTIDGKRKFARIIIKRIP